MGKKVNGSFVTLDGEAFYKIENYDCMEDFFMTITSSSDVWNFCWSQGGITAGRKDCNHAIFPYYTSDKVSNDKIITGSYTAIAVKAGAATEIWEPFANLLSNTAYKTENDNTILRNIYKNPNGTKIWFEEINTKLNLSFRYGWTSSAKFGLVKLSKIENLGASKVELTVLDGCRNILPASIDAALQSGSSVLLDAYKKTDLAQEGKVALFSLSSVLTDKAEPSESLLANVSWFTTNDKVILTPSAIRTFYENSGNIESLEEVEVLKGERASCYIAKNISLDGNKCESWEQVFDTFLNASKIASLQSQLKDKNAARNALLSDINSTDELMTTYIREADGVQNTAATMTCVHHRANVMFNIMRGGFFADNGKINCPDLIKFIGERNVQEVEAAKKALGELADKYSVQKDDVAKAFCDSGNLQLTRLYLEYLPMIFSRRHGDPSRPWNRFNIKLNDDSGNPILNYEGNWRDIFQNWEALAMSYPSYIKNMCAKFLNAMTADGFNPYRISRDGIDWECPEPSNPWAQYGYWGDHQVIYFEKLLELWDKTDRANLLASLNESIYSSANIPYRLKSYSEICKDPRSTIDFDQALSDTLISKSKTYGTDIKLIQNKDGNVALVSLTAKILQIVIAKTANLVPAGGIWMNTQRPEWNDANNALAGYGLSVVTLCYLNRMLSFLLKIYSETSIEKFTLPSAIYSCLKGLAELYNPASFDKVLTDDKERKIFTDKAGILFETERNEFYANGYNGDFREISKDELLAVFENFRALVKLSIDANKKENGLYHTYNTLLITDDEMKIERLQEMLEGQVAVLSAQSLNSSQILELLSSLKASRIFEPHQYSYTLYPNKELPHFLRKNNIKESDIASFKDFIAKTGNDILEKDCNGVYHFNAEFHNARLMEDYIKNLPAQMQPTEAQLNALLELYEATFNHQSFTGRSGTFYAYEGLGSIYWHMCSKLLLAVQENCLEAFKAGDKNAKALEDAYYDVRKGLSFNKSPELYGAFPSDPYSHTPYLQGAKQPGMTGQVKEEVLTRWGELGVDIADGKVSFAPKILKKDEFFDNGTLSFTWCGVEIIYRNTGKESVVIEYNDGTKENFSGSTLPEKETELLFTRSGKIKCITVEVNVSE